MSEFNPDRRFTDECRFVTDCKKLYSAGYRKISKYDMLLLNEMNNEKALVNNMEKICVDFVVDTLLNRPKDTEDKLIKYNDTDREVLIGFIIEQINALEENRINISSSSYRGLIDMYEGMYRLLKNDTI